jgi:hypothetical protein
MKLTTECQQYGVQAIVLAGPTAGVQSESTDLRFVVFKTERPTPIVVDFPHVSSLMFIATAGHQRHQECLHRPLSARDLIPTGLRG